MKIVLIGLGSIGKRHLRNLLQLGYKCISIVSRSGILPDEFSNFTVYSSLDQALAASRYDAAIVCTPTSLHTSAVRTLFKALIPKIYLEKPVSHTYDGINELVQLSAAYSNSITVGYDLHFEPGLMKVKELLEQNMIGKVVSVNATVGQYLPDWRPNEDYRKGMSARIETGGGVMLDLVHELDYLYWLLGPIKTIACQYSHSGSLQIQTEDVAEMVLRFTNGVVGTVHLDYLQQKLVRNCLITGSNGSINWDPIQCEVWWINKEKIEERYSYVGYTRNDRFLSIMKAFLEDTPDSRLTNLQEGLCSLRYVLAAKRSSEQQAFIQMDSFNPLAN